LIGGETDLMYLLDTNIFLELLLDQEKADEVEKLLHSLRGRDVFISEFSLYSIGIILFRQKLYYVFTEFIGDVIFKGGIGVLRLFPGDFRRLVEVAKQFDLDFDDAYQYVIAEKYGLTIVSFDSDFDKTELGRKTPSDVLYSLK
jgi:predicted nucleic acid-binding protein